MMPLVVWLSHPERWVALALLIWALAFAWRLRRGRRARQMTAALRRRIRGMPRTSALGDLLLMMSAYALVLILTDPAGRGQMLLAGLPALAAVLWFGLPDGLARCSAARRERRLRLRLQQTSRLSLDAVAELADVAVPASTDAWLQLARQPADFRDEAAPLRAWRCLDRALGLAEPGQREQVLATEREFGSLSPGALSSMIEGPEPRTLAGLEGAVRRGLHSLADERLPSGLRAAVTARVYCRLRELEPALDPISANELWWRATRLGRDREEWLAASERLASREPGGTAPEPLLAEALAGLIRLTAAAACAAPRLVVRPGLESVTTGTWCRGPENARERPDEQLLASLEDGFCAAAAGRIGRLPAAVACETVAVWAGRTQDADLLAELTAALTRRGQRRPVSDELAILTAQSGRFRQAWAAPVLATMEAHVAEQHRFDAAHGRLVLALAWSALDPARALAALAPLLDPPPEWGTAEQLAIGLFRRPLIEVLARLRHPDVDGLLWQQAAAEDYPEGLSLEWRAAAWSALARRGVSAAWGPLDELLPQRHRDHREWAAQLALCAAAGSAGALAAAEDYVLGRNGAGPPGTWSAQVQHDCRQRMLERLVAGQVYRRSLDLSIATPQGHRLEAPNGGAEVCCDALPLPA